MDSKFKCVFDDPNEEKSVNGNPNVNSIVGGGDNGDSESGRFGAVMPKVSNQQQQQPQQQQPIDSGRFSSAVSEVESHRKTDKDDEQSGEELKDNFSSDSRSKSIRSTKAKVRIVSEQIRILYNNLSPTQEENVPESESHFEAAASISKQSFPTSQASSQSRSQASVGGGGVGATGAYLRSNVAASNLATNFSSNLASAYPTPAGLKSNELGLLESPNFVYLVGGIFAALVIGFILGKIF